MRGRESVHLRVRRFFPPCRGVFQRSPDLLEFVERNPIRPARHTAVARAALERRTIHIEDVQPIPITPSGRKIDPIRTVLAVPMLAEDRVVGAIVVYRLEVSPFAAKQIALVSTFADQATIAVENARYFRSSRPAIASLARLRAADRYRRDPAYDLDLSDRRSTGVRDDRQECGQAMQCPLFLRISI